jgi:hypothetical protein
MMNKDGEEGVGIMKTTTCFERHMENREMRSRRESN